MAESFARRARDWAPGAGVRRQSSAVGRKTEAVEPLPARSAGGRGQSGSSRSALRLLSSAIRDFESIATVWRRSHGRFNLRPTSVSSISDWPDRMVFELARKLRAMPQMQQALFIACQALDCRAKKARSASRLSIISRQATRLGRTFPDALRSLNQRMRAMPLLPFSCRALLDLPS